MRISNTLLQIFMIKAAVLSARTMLARILKRSLLMNQNDTPPFQIIVVSDLDGSFLDHSSYSFEAAIPALNRLRAIDVLPIFSSSKTASEIRKIQEDIGFIAPFACENGAAFYVPSQRAPLKIFARKRLEWIDAIHDVRKVLGAKFIGFSDWQAESLAKVTGLTIAEARCAQQREFTEPILWQDTTEKRRQFDDALRDLGLITQEGGRFISIQSHSDKSRSSKWWRSQHCPRRTCVLALGDSPNDAALLDSADIAIVIKSEKSDLLRPRFPCRVIRTVLPGPSGWNEGMQKALQLIETGQFKLTHDDT